MFQGNNDDGDGGGQGGFAYRDNFVRDESHLNDRVGGTQMRAFDPDPGFGPVYLDVNPHNIYTWTVYNTMVSKALGIPQNRLRMLRQSHIDDFEVGVDYAYVVKGGEFKGKLITDMVGADLYDGRFVLVFTYRGFFILCRILYVLPSRKRLDPDVQQLIKNCSERALPPRNLAAMDPRLVEFLAKGKIIDVSAPTSQGDLFAPEPESAPEETITPEPESAPVALEDVEIPLPRALAVEDAVADLQATVTPEVTEQPVEPPRKDIPRLEIDYEEDREGGGLARLKMFFSDGTVVRWGARMDRYDRVNFFISCKGIRYFLPFSVAHIQGTAKKMGLDDNERVYAAGSRRWGKKWMFSHVGLLDWCKAQIAEMEKKRLVSPKSVQKLDRLREFYAGLKEAYDVYEEERRIRHEEVTPPDVVEGTVVSDTTADVQPAGVTDDKKAPGKPVATEPAKLTEEEKSQLLARYQSRVIFLPGRPPCMLDRDVAAFYGVSTSHFNQRTKGNDKRFPIPEYRFQPSESEISRIVTSRDDIDFFEKTPWLYTEEGSYMGHAVLRSERAVQVGHLVVRVFIAHVKGDLPSGKGPVFARPGSGGGVVTDAQLAQSLAMVEMAQTVHETLLGLRSVDTDLQGHKAVFTEHKQETRKNFDRTNERIDQTDEQVRENTKDVATLKKRGIFGMYVDPQVLGPTDAHRKMARSELSRENIRRLAQYHGYLNCLSYGGYKAMEAHKSEDEFRSAYREFYQAYAKYKGIKPKTKKSGKPTMWDAVHDEFGLHAKKNPLDWFERKGPDEIFDGCEFLYLSAQERRAKMLGLI